MKVLRPLCRAGHDLASSTASRIPHLHVHIVAREPRRKAKNPPIHARIRHEQSLHTTPYTSSLFLGANGEIQDLPQGATLETAQDAPATTPVSYPVESDSSIINNILEERHPERVLFTLLDESVGPAFIRRAEPTAFTRAFTALDPHYLFQPIKDVYRFLKPSLSSDPTYRWVRHIGGRFASFSINLESIASQRRDAGHKLSLDDYRHMLDCARTMGHLPLASRVMRKMMKEDGVEPDLQCYNYLMEAHSWSHAWSKTEQWRLRVTPRILELRSKHWRQPDLKGHRTGPSGLRYRTLSLFKEMVAKGHKGDEATFTSLMTAMGREGDLTGAKSILRSVYNIDVDLLHDVDEEEVETPTFYEPDSPLRPTARLLFTVAHVWGSNNDATSAYKLVDYISRQYDLQIPFHVWMQLLEWTFLLSLRRSGTERRQGQNQGQVPPETLDRLWEAMTDVPHSIEPDGPMLTMRIRAQRDLLKLDETLASLQRARVKLDAEREQLSGLADRVMNWIERWIANEPTDEFLPAEWYDLRRTFLVKSLKVDRDLQLMATDSRRVLKEFHWPEFTPPEVRRERGHPQRKELWTEFNLGYQSRLFEWERRVLPKLVDDFAEYIPNSLLYKTSGGYIAIDGKNHRTDILAARWGHQMWKNGIIRAAVDTDNYVQMVAGMRRLPLVIKRYEQYCFTCETAEHAPGQCPVQRDDLQDSVVKRMATDVEMTMKRGSRTTMSPRRYSRSMKTDGKLKSEVK